jgi:hypothetical protein
MAVPAPPDAVVMAEGQRRFVSGPFDAGPAMLISPSCTIAAQGPTAPPGSYALPARTLVPIRPVAELVDAGAIPEPNLGNLRADRLVNYLYLPPHKRWPESTALLYLPLTVHHDVIAQDRVAQLTGAAFWHLRVKLMAFIGGFLLDPGELGDIPAPHQPTELIVVRRPSDARDGRSTVRATPRRCGPPESAPPPPRRTGAGVPEAPGPTRAPARPIAPRSTAPDDHLDANATAWTRSLQPRA